MKHFAVLSLAAVGAVAMASPAPGVANTWAVIAVGSKGFMNYRHQADGCHAYQVLRTSGVPAEQIILMMQDDVASSTENPFPGKLFNKNGTDVPDVYAGCQIDYRGSIVTAELFTKVITGDSSAGGKVLKSTSSDRVFLNFIDHGGVGLVAFPNGPFLHATDLSTALETMKQKNMFSELLFYMEACESGSMFPNLTPDGKIFAVTAANGKESSWGWYCMPDGDKVNGKDMHTCLGDLFSISWMEDADKGQFSTETIKQQVDKVTARTSKSHVSTFGDSSFENEPFGNFALQVNGASSAYDAHTDELRRHHNAIDVRDIPMNTAYWRATHAHSETEKEAAWKEYREIMDARKSDDGVFHEIVKDACKDSLSLPIFKECAANMHTSSPDLKSDAALQCHKTLASAVFGSCPSRSSHSPGGWNAYNMKYSKQLANICIHMESLHQDVARLEGFVHSRCGGITSEIVV